MADPLDTLRPVATPEGIELQLRLAGPVVRAGAWAIDLAVRLALLAAVAGAAGFLGALSTPLAFIAFFLLEWLYPSFCEVHLGGATPGKRAMGVRVVHDDGRPVGWTASLIRNLLRAADFFPVLYGAGLVSMLASRDFKRLGDFAAATVVVYDEPARQSNRLIEAGAIAPPVPLSLAEQRTLMDFAERVASLTEERAQELAEAVPALTAGTEGREAIRRLSAYASYLHSGGE